MQPAFSDIWDALSIYSPEYGIDILKTKDNVESLLAIFSNVCNHLEGRTVKFCFFIDGLDEYEAVLKLSSKSSTSSNRCIR